MKKLRRSSAVLLATVAIAVPAVMGCDDAETTAPPTGGLPDAASDATADTSMDANAELSTDVAIDTVAEDSADGTGEEADAPEPLPAVGFGFVQAERGVDLTPDGRRALLWQQSTGELIIDNVVTGNLQIKTTLDTTELQNQQPHAMSANLRIAAGYGFQPGQAGLWSEPSGWLKLGSPLAGCIDTSGPTPVVVDLGSAFDVSVDGLVAVGFLWDGCGSGTAFRWTDASGSGVFTLLDKVGAAGFERATVVSADGKLAAGFAPNQGDEFLIDRSPAMWKEDGSGALLDPSNVTEPGEVKAITPDGHLLAGDWASAKGGQNGFTWTQSTGVVRFSTPSPTPEQDSIFVNAMSANGKFILGAVSTFDPNTLNTTQVAYGWTPTGGVQLLRELATSNGLTIPSDTSLTNVMAVSDDGTVILGDAEVAPPPNDPTGFPTPKVFILVLPAAAVPQ